MKLSFMLTQARAGELASVSAKDKTDEKIVSYINLALIALYNRFQLATQETIITLRPDIPKTLYTMDSSDTDVLVAGQPMPDDDFMAIVAAFNEDGSRISVNDDADPFSIYTATYNQLQIPLVLNEDNTPNSYVSVIYRKNPDMVVFVDAGGGKAEEASVKLPLQLIEAALHYVGYRAHGAINGNVKAENNTHFTRYLHACDTAEKLGVITADDTTGADVIDKGYL